MTLQEAIDNTPEWSAVYGCFEELGPTMFDNGPQLIEVNK